MSEKFYEDRLALRSRGEAGRPGGEDSKPADIVERESKAASAFARASESESIHSALLLNASEIIDVLCDEIERMRDALIVLMAAEAAPRGREKYPRLMAARKIARAALIKPETTHD